MPDPDGDVIPGVRVLRRVRSRDLPELLLRDILGDTGPGTATSDVREAHESTLIVAEEFLLDTFDGPDGIVRKIIDLSDPT